MAVGGQRLDLLTQPGDPEAIGHLGMDLRDLGHAPLHVLGHLGDIERVVEALGAGNAPGQWRRHARRGPGRCLRRCRRLVRQPITERFHCRHEPLEGVLHRLGQARRAQEPRRRTRRQPAFLDQQLRLHGIGNLVVERLDELPQRDVTHDLARRQVGAHHLRRCSPGHLAEAVHERRADPVDHAVEDVGGDDLAAQRMARDVGAELVTQLRGKVARERGAEPRVLRQVGELPMREQGAAEVGGRPLGMIVGVELPQPSVGDHFGQRLAIVAHLGRGQAQHRVDRQRGCSWWSRCVEGVARPAACLASLRPRPAPAGFEPAPLARRGYATKGNLAVQRCRTGADSTNRPARTG